MARGAEPQGNGESVTLRRLGSPEQETEGGGVLLAERPRRVHRPPVSDFIPIGSKLGKARRSELVGGWCDWMQPHFPEGSIYFTGTYSDDYGLTHGCQYPDAVANDFNRWLAWVRFDGEWVACIEPHAHRDSKVLHLHAVLSPVGLQTAACAPTDLSGNGARPSPKGETCLPEGGARGEDIRLALKWMWELERGWAKVLPVQDGCLSYVTKYVLKDDNADRLLWRFN